MSGFSMAEANTLSKVRSREHARAAGPCHSRLPDPSCYMLNRMFGPLNLSSVVIPHRACPEVLSGNDDTEGREKIQEMAAVICRRKQKQILGKSLN